VARKIIPDPGLFSRLVGSCFKALSMVTLAALCCLSGAKADPPPTPAPAETESSPVLPEIMAEAERAALERRVEVFIRALTRNPGAPDDYSVVRWNTSICILVAGLSTKSASTVSAKVSQISASAGAPLARTPCQPNFIIVATADPDQVLNAWYAHDKGLFGNATPAQIHQFLESSRSRPVRVWYNIDRGRKAGMRNGHFVPSTTQAESSVFLGNAVFDFLSVFAIVDTQRTQQASLDQLADYVAMAGLTTVDLKADLGSAPSILRLFATSQQGGPSGLSTWDAAFLKALYQSNQASRTQRFEIERRVNQEILR